MNCTDSLESAKRITFAVRQVAVDLFVLQSHLPNVIRHLMVARNIRRILAVG